MRIVDSNIARDGLDRMLYAMIGDHAYNLGCVDVEIALLIIELAMRAEDLEIWFPLGKWATIQSIQHRAKSELDNMIYSRQTQ